MALLSGGACWGSFTPQQGALQAWPCTGVRVWIYLPNQIPVKPVLHHTRSSKVVGYTHWSHSVRWYIVWNQKGQNFLRETVQVLFPSSSFSNYRVKGSMISGKEQPPWTHSRSPVGLTHKLVRQHLGLNRLRRSLSSGLRSIDRHGRCFTGQGPLLTATCWEQDRSGAGLPTTHWGRCCLGFGRNSLFCYTPGDSCVNLVGHDWDHWYCSPQDEPRARVVHKPWCLTSLPPFPPEHGDLVATVRNHFLLLE